MTFLDPCNDWAFKRIFGSRESEPVLIGFLNDLLHGGRPVVRKARILDPYLPSQAHSLKNTAVDVRATLEDGSEVLIEMQMFPVAGFCERVLYNGAKCVASQLGRGSDYSRLRQVTVITVADCVLLKDTDAWLSHFTLHETRQNLSWPVCGLEFIFVELPKVALEKLPASEPLHDWLEFLKNAPSWHKMPSGVTNAAVREALRLSRHDSLSPAEALTMTRRQLYRQDQINMRRHALTEGLEQGVQQGMQQGMQQGRRLGVAEATQKMAAKLLQHGMSQAEVKQITGMSLRQLQTLAATRPKRRAASRPKD